MTVLNCCGGHSVKVYSNAVYDPSIRKYRLGPDSQLLAEIPFGGQMVSATPSAATPGESLVVDGVEIPTTNPSGWEKVDALPEGADYCIVSAMYVAAAKALGADTSKCLTMGGTVVDDTGRTIGVTGFNRN